MLHYLARTRAIATVLLGLAGLPPWAGAQGAKRPSTAAPSEMGISLEDTRRDAPTETKPKEGEKHGAEIDDEKILREVTEDILDQEKEARGAKGGLRAHGADWPNGAKDGAVRFIRLKYGGGDWDQDMGRDADYNLLLYFRKTSGLPIAAKTEAIEIDRLRKFPKGQAPPFVYLTGRGKIDVTDREVKTLRWYCLEEGGLLFADSGGRSFDRSFRALCRKVFPDKALRDIASDDPILRHPSPFPNGAPPLWRHSGLRAQGIMHQGRWMVFYHQGELNDAWKTGHSGLSEAMADSAYKLGINVIFYSFTHYLDRHTK